ncbi:MAG: hypothetical protein KJZ83_00425 [Burkholderiaceae bacterium]|nr:hypothetical protein [Burkholderiaceae bacterium]
MDTQHQLEPNGYLPLDLGWRGGFYTLSIAGGPYDNFPGRDQAFGVCVRAERVPEGGFDAHVPIHDFSIPNDRLALDMAIRDTFRAAIRGRDVYVGCMGGWGRTGLFLALLAKTAGVTDPVDYVREYYHPRAVETKPQARFVESFDARELQKWLHLFAWTQRVPFLRMIYS